MSADFNAAFRARLLQAGFAGPFRVASASEPVVVDRDSRPVSMPLPLMSISDRLWLAEHMATDLNLWSGHPALPQAAE